VGVLLLGYAYFHLAGEAYALVSIGLISFAAVAQFAPAVLGGMYWKGGTRAGALAGLLAGFALWAYTLMLPSIAKSGWLDADFLTHGPWGLACCAPSTAGPARAGQPDAFAVLEPAGQRRRLRGGVAVARALGREASQALLFVDVFERTAAGSPVFWRGRRRGADLLALASASWARPRRSRCLRLCARAGGAACPCHPPDANWCSLSKPSWPAPSAALRRG
jgi:hypothetical protein